MVVCQMFAWKNSGGKSTEIDDLSFIDASDMEVEGEVVADILASIKERRA